MGLAWQQGPLSPHSVGRFLTDVPLPERLLFAEPLRRRLRVRFAGEWIADSQDVVLLHEPGRYPVAYFPRSDIAEGVLQPEDRVTQHRDLGTTRWYAVSGAGATSGRAAWEHTELPSFAAVLAGRVAFAWQAMEGFFEEDERVLGHAADFYHRIDIRDTSRHLVVRHNGATIAESKAPKVLYESGFAPRWYVPRSDVDESRLARAAGQTFCPYKGLATYYDIGEARGAAWSYEDAFSEVARIDTLLSFEPDLIEVLLDGVRQKLEPGQLVVPHGLDRGLDPSELRDGGAARKEGVVA